MSTNKKWLFALNLLIFFEKRLVKFDKWSKWHLDLFFSQNSKNYRNHPPQKKIFQKNNWKFATVKKNKKQAPIISTTNLTSKNES